MAKVPLAKHDDIVQAFPPDRADQPFGISVLPRRSRRSRPVTNAHRPKAANENITVDSVAVTDDVLRCCLPTIGLHQLACDPFSRWVRGCSQPHDLAATVLQYQQAIEQPERGGRNHEQIHRGDAVSMITQKGLPALRRWLPSSRHVFCHGGLPDLDAKREQFAVDPRCSPKRVRDAHVTNSLWGAPR